MFKPILILRPLFVFLRASSAIFLAQAAAFLSRLALLLVVPLVCSTVAVAESVGNYGQKPIVYLTFDDGPSGDKVTGHILDVLAEHDAKATFFVTGSRVKANPEKIARIVYEGHALGNHTMSHGKLTTLSDDQVIQEFKRTGNYVYDAGGPKLHCFRAPFGATDRRVNGIAIRLGMRSVGWTIDTRDWDEFADPEHLAVQLEDTYHKSVVLLHDGPSSRWRTLAVFSRWMDDVGHLYDFKALPDCVHPLEPSYASLAAEPFAPKAGKPALGDDDLTIASLLEKLSRYEFDLQPEVVAQNENKPSTNL